MRPLESPPPAFKVESITVAAHAAHDGLFIRRVFGELGREMPDDVVNGRELRKAIVKYAPVAHHVGDLIGEICKSKFADPILQPVGIPVHSRHCIRSGAVRCKLKQQYYSNTVASQYRKSGRETLPNSVAGTQTIAHTVGRPAL